MNPHELKQRTRNFALRVIRLCTSLPRNAVCDVIERQLLRAGTSAGANYRAACKARSAAEFAAKIGVVEEEADETVYWMELLIDVKAVSASKLATLIQEAAELTAIAAASRKTSRSGVRHGTAAQNRQSGRKPSS